MEASSPFYFRPWIYYYKRRYDDGVVFGQQAEPMLMHSCVSSKYTKCMMQPRGGFFSWFYFLESVMYSKSSFVLWYLYVVYFGIRNKNCDMTKGDWLMVWNFSPRGQPSCLGYVVEVVMQKLWEEKMRGRWWGTLINYISWVYRASTTWSILLDYVELPFNV